MIFNLKRWSMEYLNDLVKYANNKNIAYKLRDAFPHPYTLEDARLYIKYCMESDEKKQLCRAVVINGEAVGSIGLFFRGDVYCKTAEIGYWLAEEFWGMGIMSNAIKKFCTEIFNEIDYDIVRIFAEPFADNIASRRVLEKAGFNLEGIMKNSIFKNGELKDSCMYALLK